MFQREATFTKEETSVQDSETKKASASPVKVVSNSPSKAGPRSPTKAANESPRKLFSNNLASGAQCIGATPKQINWDKNVLDTLVSWI